MIASKIGNMAQMFKAADSKPKRLVLSRHTFEEICEDCRLLTGVDVPFEDQVEWHRRGFSFVGYMFGVRTFVADSLEPGQWRFDFEE